MFALIGLVLVFRFASALRAHQVFTTDNHTRLWAIALLVGIGGSLNAWLDEFAYSWIVERSAAAPFVDLSVNFTFIPLIIGMGLALVASAWPTGDIETVDLVESELAYS